MQGLERKAIQALLKHPAFVEAVHGMLRPYSRVLPALAIPVPELTRRLGAAAAQLAFVQRCHTRLQFSDSRAVRAQTHSLAQVGPSRTACAHSHRVAHVLYDLQLRAAGLCAALPYVAAIRQQRRSHGPDP